MIMALILITEGSWCPQMICGRNTSPWRVISLYSRFLKARPTRLKYTEWLLALERGSDIIVTEAGRESTRGKKDILILKWVVAAAAVVLPKELVAKVERISLRDRREWTFWVFSLPSCLCFRAWAQTIALQIRTLKSTFPWHNHQARELSHFLL